ncbi:MULTISPECIES: GntR family transcriptional regulator [unclassified Aureimonas]|uniref:GntR family transcriptional regulator n=1 Tax=unclassified Aureimonas TaxID=2615206 RepID=UPI0006F2FD24|nr:MULTISPECIES: GntR family transcriptional regulator [unclassified Aureimonas]KQT63313.1 GntR family transcriptional regulator [Aureimonas sp. Leaf427]KQT80107.1 GntR family transcriptional regulator [Aureimonas sp. Leaf460]
MSQQAAIDRLGSEPYYLQLHRLVEQQIQNGTLAPGERLPSESELCRRYDLSRSTVRETMRSLQEKKVIKMVPRRGAFVLDPEQRGWRLQVPAGFFETEVTHNNRNVETKTIRATLEVLPPEIAKALKLGADEKGFVLARLRRLDGRVALYSVNYMLPMVQELLIPSGVVEGRASLNRTLVEAGFSVFGARRSVAAVLADEKLSGLLEVKIGAPLLLVTSISWTKDGRNFDYYTSWIRNDVVEVTVEAEADPQDA